MLKNTGKQISVAFRKIVIGSINGKEYYCKEIDKKLCPLIGCTDQGEPADPNSNIVADFDNFLFTVFVTKGIPRPDITDWIKNHPGRYIIHFTVTGLGGTVLEPGVKPFKEHYDEVEKFIKNNNVNINHVFIRVDPIYPTIEGAAVAKAVIEEGYRRGFRQFRYSWMDPYIHARYRTLKRGYSGFDFARNTRIAGFADEVEADLPGVKLYSCAELDNHLRGCVSAEDFKTLGFDSALAAPRGIQRSTCGCISTKFAVMTHGYRPCKHNCSYCYMGKDVNSANIDKLCAELAPQAKDVSVIFKNILEQKKKNKMRVISFYMGNNKFAENNWLSNMATVDIKINGMLFHSAEAAFQAMKFQSPEEQKRFTEMSPVQAKRFGKHGDSFVGKERWDAHKVWVMAKILWAKFNIPEFKEKLLATGDSYLLENSGFPNDYWGGYENMTGKIIMMIRDHIMELEGGKKPWNILDEAKNVKYIVSESNCLGIEDKGLVSTANSKFDAQRDIYHKYCAQKKLRGGDILKTSGMIFAMTKEDWRKPSKLEWIRKIAANIRQNCSGDIAIPKLGCGKETEGLNWLDVFPYILSALEGYQGKIILNGINLSLPKKTLFELFSGKCGI